MSSTNNIDNLSINTIRFLAADAIQKANSGHPGMPMGCAPIAHLLYSKIMNHNPDNPKWFNRDRFILSAGHGSMLLYSALHLAGYDLSLDEIKNFRQWGSITPGHPEVHLTPGVETTTGPLGQGFANGIGMALSYKYLSALFNKEDIKIFDHHIYAIVSDGEIMEGISHETASFAGHNKLGNLIYFYDDNQISIEGSTGITMSENVEQRFLAYGWQVLKVNDVNNLEELEKAIEEAKAETSKPTLIITKTVIGFGSPNKANTAGVHGSPLGEEELKLTKENLGWNPELKFHIPDEVKNYYAEAKKRALENYNNWEKLYEEYKSKYPEDALKLENILNGNLGDEWKKTLPEFGVGEDMATRAASGKVLNAISEYLPQLIGGSADLAPSNNTYVKDAGDFSAENYKGKNFHFGIREHAMGSMMNGMALYGGIIPYGGTFLVFADYMRPAIRIAALSDIHAIYVLTHDSIGLGEDGPTHQPIEHLASLRAIPNLVVIRPADANETVEAWKTALELKDRPVAIALTRQKTKTLDRTNLAPANLLSKGAYILKDVKEPKVLLMATGSEVEIALETAKILEEKNIPSRVVSFPSWELFLMQDDEYQKSVLDCQGLRVSIEAGLKQGWEQFTGIKGINISLERFGASAPHNVLYEKFGFTAETIAKKIEEKL